MANVKLMGFCLMVDDVLASRKFYEEILGQEIEMNFNDVNVGYKGGLGLWQKAYAHNLIFGKQIVSKDNNNLEIYFETPEIEKLCEKVKANEVKFVHDMMTQPWQQRCFRVYDPDNFIVEIAESMPDTILRLHRTGMETKEIVEKTMMPEEMVKAIIG